MVIIYISIVNNYNRPPGENQKVSMVSSVDVSVVPSECQRSVTDLTVRPAILCQMVSRSSLFPTLRI